MSVDLIQQNSTLGNLACSFCGKGTNQVRKIVAGPVAHICNLCLDACRGICDDDAKIPSVLSRDLDQRFLSGVAGKSPITPSQASLVRALANHWNHYVAYDQLIDDLWGWRSKDLDAPRRTIDVHVCRLRRKISAVQAPYRIETSWGFGYRITNAESMGSVLTVVAGRSFYEDTRLGTTLRCRRKQERRRLSLS